GGSQAMKVLLGEDDEDLSELLAHALRRAGHQVVKATDGCQALARWRTGQPDFMLLDVNMPRLDGFEVCQRVRQQSMRPIAMLTVRAQEHDIIHGLQIGADDYVVKPVSARQLMARMSAVLRRTRPAAGAPEAAQTLRVGDLVLDLLPCELRQGGRPVHLTPL